MKKIEIEAIITETLEFGSCYIGSYAEDFAAMTNKTFKQIERYAREHYLDTTYWTDDNRDCYLVKVTRA